MCGIIGYTGKKEALHILLDGLASLEYRGYDSAGISICGQESIKTVKCAGRVSALKALCEGNPDLDGRCGIGHTRWATHGTPDEKNAHPHISDHLALVHNGIIENYLPLRRELEAQGYRFVSETDTESAAHLIDSFYRVSHDPLAAVIAAGKKLVGSFALGIIFRDRADEIYAIRRDSPLIVAKNEEGSFVASDIPALLPHTRDIIRIKEGEVARLTPDGITCYDEEGRQIEKATERITWNIDAAQKEGYPYFMLKEIHEQPGAIQRTVSGRIHADFLPSFENDGIDDELLSSADTVSLVGCGSAMHAGLVGRMMFEELAGIPATVDLASEYRYSPPVTKGNTLTVAISQSGETSDTLQALRLARSRGSRILGVVNVVGSAIARETDAVVYTNAGPEIAVATTKGYSTQVTALALIAIRMGLLKGKLKEEAAAALCRELSTEIPNRISEIIARREEIKKIAENICLHDNLFYIGRGPDAYSSHECSLKLKEISYVHSEAYAAGELKHGTLSLVVEGTPVIALATVSKYHDKMAGNIREVKSRGGHVILLHSPDFRSPEECADETFMLSACSPMLSPLQSVVFSQLLAYETAILRGCDVDHPRNLAKSVTVE